MAQKLVYKVSIEGYEDILKKIGKLEKVFKKVDESQKQRSKAIKKQKEANDDLVDAYQGLIDKQGAFISAVGKATTNIDKLVESTNAMDVSVSKGQEAYKKAGNEIESVATKASKMIQINTSLSGSLAGVSAKWKGAFKEGVSGSYEMSDSTIDLDLDVNKLLSSTTNLAGTVSGGLSSAFSLMTGAVGMAASAGKAMIDVGADLVESALAQEQAENGLTAALGHKSQALIDQAAALQQKTAFSDQEILASQQVLAQYGLTEQEIQKLTPTILDLAAAQGTTAAEAATALTENLNGTSTSFKKFGVDLSGAKSNGDKLGVAMEGLRGKFSGMAEEAGNKGSGAIDKLKNNFEEAKNQLGNGLLKVLGQLAPVINPIVVAVSDFFKKIVDGLEGSKQFNTILGDLKEFLSALSVPVQMLIDSLSTIYQQLFVPIYGFIKESLVPVFDALREAFTLQSGETTKMINPTKVLANILGAVLRPALDVIAYVIENAVIPVIQKMGEWIQAVAEPISDLAKGISEFFGVAGAIDNNTTVIDKSFGKLKDSANDCSDAIETNTEMLEENSEVVGDTSKGLQDLTSDLGSNAGAYDDSTKAAQEYIDKLKEQIKAMEDTIAKQQELADAQEDDPETNDDTTNDGESSNVTNGDGASDEGTEEDAPCPAEKAKECNNEEIDANIEKANTILNTTKEFIGKMDELNQAQLELDLARIEERRSAEIDAVNDSTLSEEEKQAKLAAINDKYDKQAEEKRKAAAKRKKALAITTALINGALAVTQAISQFGPPPSPAGIAGIAAAAVTTALQVATIAKQKFAKGGVIPFAKGGAIAGPLHSNGGVPFSVGGQMMEAEGGELIVNRNIWSRPDLVRNISEMNAMTGGKRFFAAGGVVPQAGVKAKSSADIDMRSEVMTQELVNGLRGVIADEVGSLRVVNNVVDTTDQQVTVINQQTESSF